MRTRSNSPIHEHVSEATPEATPVHVHAKSQRSLTRTPQGKVKHDKGILQATAKVKTRVPWIPPGKSPVRDASYKWEGPLHCLKITPQPTKEEHEESQSVLRLDDLMNNEDGIHGRIKQYEQKIDSLMTEVSSLKNEVELKKKEQQLERQSEQLSISQRLIAEQEKELAVVTKELEQTAQENTQLRHSVEKMLAGIDHNSVEQLGRDALLTKLLEAEVDGTAASKQMSALRESVCKMSSANDGLSALKSTHLDHQKELLMQKLETFEMTNKALRHLLRQHHKLHVPKSIV